MTLSRTLYIFKFLVRFSDVHYFCIKCKYHISKIWLRIATERARITPQILLTTKSTVFTLKILLLASKPTGHLVPRCRNNFQLCLPPLTPKVRDYPSYKVGPSSLPYWRWG